VSALRLSPVLVGWAELAAALVNTRPRETDPPEKLVGVDDLRRLLADAPEPAPPAGPRDLEAVRALREPLFAAFDAPSLDALAGALNPLLAGAPTELRAVDGQWALVPAGGTEPASWLGAGAARGLAEVAVAYGIDRLHVCRADDCLCVAVDGSRNGTRLYCSRTCANRVNARRHRHAAA
jgi:predicted RNA-binding Zn ribbon-like protein